MGAVLLIASLLAAVTQGVPQIPSNVKTIISGIVAGVTGIINSGVTTTIDPATILAALSALIASLKTIPQLPQATLSLIAGLEDATAAALAADQVAKTSENPTLLQPIQALP